MRILVMPGTDDCANLGDLAMLQIAVGRLKALWPDARIQVFTSAFDALKKHHPDVEPVPMRSIKCWLRVGALPRWFFPRIQPERRRCFPLTFNRLWQLGGLLYLPDYRLARQFAEALFNSNLLVLSGCGLITDEFQYAALRVLDVFGTAIKCGIPTVMLSQGFGPIHSELLRKRAAAVLPRVNAIFVREQHASLPLLKQLGVSHEKIFVTGDDAIGLAFRNNKTGRRTHLGVNLRLAKYAALDGKILDEVREVLIGKARQFQTRLVGIPITCSDTDSDVQTLERLLPQPQNDVKGMENPVTLPEIIRRISDCRVVVAGSYHAGVFALSQGIPVAAIVQSEYYQDKFHGLAGQFGAGCVVLRADDRGFAGNLDATVDQLWHDADALRPKLLAAAEQQMQAACNTYARLPEMIRQGKPGQVPCYNS
ncbi:MAG: polysaccharide pyruvyl transferase family protein [Verrucomicrobiota bacterium]